MASLDLKQWDIWQVEWTHFDPNAVKENGRPAVVFSTIEELADEKIARCWCISSQNHPSNQPRVMIRKGTLGFQGSGLDTTSWVYMTDEQHLRLTSPPFLRHRGACNLITQAGLIMASKAVGKRPLANPPAEDYQV